ncbi:MAG: hypothetical protein [Enterobacter phage ENC19]|nr:MAG: hypothetical protein [Enterobacter phage ENC19]
MSKDDIPVHNRIRDQLTFRSRDRAIMVGSYLHWWKHKDLDLNPSYQRPYVWTQKEQDAFLTTLISGFPCGIIAIAVDSQFNETHWVEVIDGKQRLTTIIKVYEGEIGIPMPDGSRLFWDEMPRHEQRAFENISLPALGLDECTKKDRLEFFIKLNFAGVPQSQEHMNRVLEMYKAAK